MDSKTLKGEMEHYNIDMDREDKTKLIRIVINTMGYFSLLGLVGFLFRIFLIIYVSEVYIAYENNFIVLILELIMCLCLSFFILYRVIINIKKCKTGLPAIEKKDADNQIYIVRNIIFEQSG